MPLFLFLSTQTMHIKAKHTAALLCFPKKTLGQFFKQIFAPTEKVGTYASVGFGSVCA
jgi:hypothetical protein